MKLMPIPVTREVFDMINAGSLVDVCSAGTCRAQSVRVAAVQCQDSDCVAYVLFSDEFEPSGLDGTDENHPVIFLRTQN